jgi:8-oxo-dGTP pyrophosphatase MutT (NUDIX family)
VPGRAAVAVLVRYDGSAPRILLIERAVREGDRWSGQVSLPGGRVDESDADLLATAVRETREEVSVDLGASARLVGRLDALQAIGRGKFLPFSVHPFVFVETRPVEPVAGDEVAAIFWLPLEEAARGSIDGEHTYQLGPIPIGFPCWKWEGRAVWGLTYRILQNLIAVVRGE